MTEKMKIWDDPNLGFQEGIEFKIPTSAARKLGATALGIDDKIKRFQLRHNI